MSTSVEKRRLLKQSDIYKDEFERELKTVKHQTNELLKNALIIGGSLALTYILFRQITASKGKKKTLNTIVSKNEQGEVQEVTTIQQPSRFATIASDIGATIANEATFFLLNLAKEKLMELLTPKETNTSTNEDS